MFWNYLYQFLLWSVGSIAFRLFAALGIGVATYTGIGASLEWVESELISQAGELPALGYSLLQLTGAGTALGIMLSAVSVRLTLAGLNTLTGSVTRWRMVTPGG